MLFKNKKIVLAALVLIIVLIISILVYVRNIYYQAQVVSDIATSHIQANVPDNDDFDKFLTRDLETYFKGIYKKDILVKYEYLREGATQTGIAYPKYYLWVTISDSNQTIDEGAARVAAIDKQRFDVTDYLSHSDIKTEVDKIYSIFPKPVCEKIKEKL